MNVKALAVVGSMVVVLLVACAAESVQAKDYDQSCTKDDDCVLVDELIADGTSCTISCTRGAINKKAQEKYATELKEEQADCTSLAQPDCLSLGSASCVQGKCTASGTKVGDAGTD